MSNINIIWLLSLFLMPSFLHANPVRRTYMVVTDGSVLPRTGFDQALAEAVTEFARAGNRVQLFWTGRSAASAYWGYDSTPNLEISPGGSIHKLRWAVQKAVDEGTLPTIILAGHATTRPKDQKKRRDYDNVLADFHSGAHNSGEFEFSALAHQLLLAARGKPVEIVLIVCQALTIKRMLLDIDSADRVPKKGGPERGPVFEVFAGFDLHGNDRPEYSIPYTRSLFQALRDNPSTEDLHRRLLKSPEEAACGVRLTTEL